MTLLTTCIRYTVVAMAILLLARPVQGQSGYSLDSNKFRFQPRYFANDTPRYPLYERYGDPYTYRNRNSFDFSDTSYIKRTVEYDPVTKQYYIIEKIGGTNYRTPVSYSMSEFLALKSAQDEREYFRKKAALLANLNRRQWKPKFNFLNDWMNRIVGNGKIEIKPNGYVSILAGYQGQNIKNPTLPERARRNGGFQFDMNSQFSMDGNIGDKLKLPINYNTLANFEFENQLKLDYQGKSDEIMKYFRAGNVSFNSKGTLVPGLQGLFGVSTQLQFGKFYISGIFANLRSQRQQANLQGGAASQVFSIRAHEYEENKHFLLAQYFRSNYNNAMKDLPLVRSAVQILRMEVWVTNRTGATTDTRDVVGLASLGEGAAPTALPSNNANGLYNTVINAAGSRNSTQVTNALTGLGLLPVQDYEKTFARKLIYGSEYTYNRQVGYVSLNQQLQPDEVMAVAFQYTYNGKVYQVGEFSTEVAPDSTGNSQKVLFLKLLKATSQRTNLPIWDLMMKNVYAVGYGQLERPDFTLDITYEEPSLGEKRYLPPDPVLDPNKARPILSMVNLDRLNNQNDPQPDGKFDWVDSFTVMPQYSRIIFPVLEPFGHDLDQFYGNQPDRDKYLFYPLYDTIKAIAETYANLNRFKLTGRSKSTVSGDYQLGFNIPRGSVTVTAGGRTLVEGVDYDINYDLGTLKVINPSILQTGLPVQIQFENQAAFGVQNKSFYAIRMDYLASKKLSIGATIAQLSERPFFTKVDYQTGDPIRNRMYEVDVDYRSQVPRLSRWLDKLPFYSTKANSSLTLYGEAAYLQPGHPKQINADKKDKEGVIYIDDFEGTKNSIDLRFPLISWTLASVPQGNPSFPEAALFNDLNSQQNRAKIAWYNIEPVLQEPRNPNNPLRNNIAELIKPQTRQVYRKEIFPNVTTNINDVILNTFDIAYYPDERGPYNFQTNGTKIDGNGKLRQPQTSWAGIMRNIDQTDFETSNVEFIEMWVMDPFKGNNSATGGQLYFNLGNISEDILRDGKRQYENGLPTPNSPAPVDQTSAFGKVPSNPIQVTTAFSNDPEDRPFQDVGFDGLSDTAEQNKYAAYLTALETQFGNTPFVQRTKGDPAGDNFRNYRDESYDQSGAGILQRYKEVNNPHGNSPVSSGNSTLVNAFTLYPDQEDLNRDNTMNEQEEYFEYKVDLQPNMSSGSNYITDVRLANITLADGTPSTEKWYLFRIPVTQYTRKVGNIPDFKSIRFIRMYLTGFDDTVVCRFGKLELVRNQWRRYTNKIDTTGNYSALPANDPTTVNVLAVNVEENDNRSPVPYVIPPGIERQQQLSNNNVNILQNEQSLSMKVCYLPQDEARGVFKTMNLDMRQYGKLRLFIHAETAEGFAQLDDGDLQGIVRLGSDVAGNYYEIKIPLKMTPYGTRDSLRIWPEANNLDFELQELINLKVRRNRSGTSPSQYYREVLPDGRSYAMIGNPNLGEVRAMLMAVQNKKTENICAELWFNELRFSRLDEEGGGAAVGSFTLNGADLFTLSVNASYRGKGFGTLEQRVNERSREDFTSLDVNFNMDAGKLLPRQLGLTLPVALGFSRTTSTPEYDPYDLDIKLKDKLRDAAANAKDSIRNDAVDQTTIKTFTLSNAKFTKPIGKKLRIWDPANLDFNYSYIKQTQHNPLIENNEITRTRGAVGYNFAPQPKFIEPFKKLIKSKSAWFNLIKEFNFNYKPSQIMVKFDVFRQFGAIRPRNVGGGPYKVPETYDKFYTFDRFYTLSWQPTKSISVDYNATNNARIDEPFGRIDTKEKKDSIKKNLFKGGRNTKFNQDITISYTLPLQKFPALDWVTARAAYTAKYDWLAGSLLTRTPEVNLGNTISNGQTRNGSAELNFDQLYNKSKLLRLINSEGPIPKNNEKKRIEVKADSAGKKTKWIRNPKWEPSPGGLARAFGRILTSIKRVGIQYNEDIGTVLPGYLDSSRYFGMNWRSMAPGLPFILGYQPDTNWINRAGVKQLLTNDTLFNSFIQQRYDQTLTLTAQISPIRDLTIDVNLNKTFNKNYTELFKDTSRVDNVGFTRLSPYGGGSFSISFISFQTLFGKFDPTTVNETFKKFESNRLILSERLAKQNGYLGSNPTPGVDGYYPGYGRYAQDVLIPAFVAAYTNKDPMSVNLVKNSNANIRSNPFSGFIPKPNWNLTYSGLSRIKGLDKVFTNFTIRHGYNSKLGMNSFNSALLFEDPLRIGFPSFQVNGNFVPYFLVPNITITESFDPLISVDMTFTNQLTVNFEYKKSRTLSLSLIDYQLADQRTTEYVASINWRKKGVPIFKKGIRLFKKEIKLDNDVTFKFDFSLRDNATSNAKLDQATAFPAAGQKVISIKPSIDYVLNSRVNLQLFFSQDRVIPVLATPAPVTNTQAGLRIQVSLNQ